MSNNSTIQQIAERLWQASLHSNTCAPVRDLIDAQDQEAAYQIQKINTDRRIGIGARKIGWKIGLTAKAVQKQLGVDQPDFGMLLSDMEVLLGEDLPFTSLMQPKVEAEIAFVLGEDLDQEYIGTTEVLKSIDFALASLEVVGSRIRDWDIKIADTIADNASASHFVLGHKPVWPGSMDLLNCKMQMWKNGEIVSEGLGSNCLGSPVNATIWLARKLQQLGTPLEAGDVVLTGALGPMTNLEQGDTIEASFDNLGAVRLQIS